MRKEEVVELYINQGMTINEVAKRLKANRTVLMNFMVKNNITKDIKINTSDTKINDGW